MEESSIKSKCESALIQLNREWQLTKEEQVAFLDEVVPIVERGLGRQGILEVKAETELDADVRAQLDVMLTNYFKFGPTVKRMLEQGTTATAQQQQRSAATSMPDPASDSTHTKPPTWHTASARIFGLAPNQDVLQAPTSAGLKQENPWEYWCWKFNKMARHDEFRPDEAEDVVQLACLHAYRALAGYDYLSTLDTFLIAVYRNVRKDRLRAAVRLRQHEPDVSDDFVLAAEPGGQLDDAFSDLAANQEAMQQVQQVLDRIKNREHLKLWYKYKVEQGRIDPTTKKWKAWTYAELAADGENGDKLTPQGIAAAIERMHRRIINDDALAPLAAKYSTREL